MSAGRAETMKLVRSLLKQGFNVERTGGGHWRVQAADGGPVVVMGFSSGSSDLSKTLKRLKEIGYTP